MFEPRATKMVQRHKKGRLDCTSGMCYFCWGRRDNENTPLQQETRCKKNVLFRTIDQSLNAHECRQGCSKGLPNVPVKRHRTSQMAKREAKRKHDLEEAEYGHIWSYNTLRPPAFPHAYRSRTHQIRRLATIAAAGLCKCHPPFRVSVLRTNTSGGNPFWHKYRLLQQTVWEFPGRLAGSSFHCDARMHQVAMAWQKGATEVFQKLPTESRVQS